MKPKPQPVILNEEEQVPELEDDDYEPEYVECKHQEALDLMIMSVYKPDSELRIEAADLGCYDELMNVREQVLEFLAGLRREAVS